MKGRHFLIAVGVLAGAAVLVMYLDRRNLAADGRVTTAQAAAVAASGLGWWNPFLPLRLQQQITSTTARDDTNKI